MKSLEATIREMNESELTEGLKQRAGLKVGKKRLAETLSGAMDRIQDMKGLIRDSSGGELEQTREMKKLFSDLIKIGDMVGKAEVLVGKIKII